MSENYTTLEGLQGQTCTSVVKDDNCITFKLDNGKEYMMYHEQDCCESVIIEDICGDLNDLVGVPLLVAEESGVDNTFEDKHDHEYRDSWTYTFYRFRTIKGTVVIRWYGTSNGYYSESVTISESENGKFEY